jgi:hypothetical protein
MFLESFLFFAQHVSDLTEPIIRSTTVVYAAIYFRFVVFYFLRLVLVFCHIAVSRLMLSTHYFAVDKIEKNEMDGACSTDGEGRGVYRVWWGNQRERDHWGDPGRIILKWVFRKWNVGVWSGISWFRIEAGDGPL